MHTIQQAGMLFAALPRIALAAAFIVVVLLAGYGLSVVRASHSDPNVIHLCVSKWTHQVRYVSTPSKCTDGQVVDVNKQGVPGPPGAQGPQGPTGADGVSGREEVIAVDNSATPGTVRSATAFCPPGKVVIGGGAAVNDPTWHLTQSRATSANSWAGEARLAPGLSDDTAVLTVSAICATVSP